MICNAAALRQELPRLYQLWDFVSACSLAERVKNVIAIGAGMSDGASALAPIARTALTTRGWSKCLASGGPWRRSGKTFMGMAGLGRSGAHLHR